MRFLAVLFYYQRCDTGTPRYILLYILSLLAERVDTGLSEAKCGTSATTAECARRAF